MTEAWRDTDYAHRKEITIQEANLAGDLTNFPLLVVIDNDIDINTGTVQADLDDVRFYDSSGNLLKFEVEWFEIDGTDCAARIWVKKPALYTSPAGYDNTIWMYYGYASAANGEDAANVWDAGYEAVWHLAESGNGTANEFADSTANAHHGQGGGGDSAKVPDQVTGMIGKGQDFIAANNDYIITGSIAHGIGTGDFCIDAWVKPDSVAEGIIYNTIWSNGAYAPAFYVPTQHGKYGLYWGAEKPSATSATTDWQHLAAVRRSGVVYFYRNGIVDGNTYSIATSVADAVSRFGTDSAADWMNGLVDEERLTVGDRSVAWLNFQYHNIAEADWEQTWGAEEDQPTLALVVQDSACLVESENVALTQHHVLVVANSECIVASESLALTQHQVLTVADSQCLVESESPSLTQHQVLTVADSACVVESESPSLTQHQVLALADSACVVESENVVLTQHSTLGVADSACVVESDNVVLVQHHVLTVADSECVVTSDNVTLAVEAGSVVLFQQQLLLAV
ncbi:MAG: DUF2341 domain-containing protein [Chloroflexota bacterium]